MSIPSVPRIVSGLYPTGAPVHTRFGSGTVAGTHVGGRGRAWILVILDLALAVDLPPGTRETLGIVVEPAEYVYEREG